MDSWDQYERPNRTYQDGRRDGWREGYEAALCDMTMRKAHTKSKDDLIDRAIQIILAKLVIAAGK